MNPRTPSLRRAFTILSLLLIGSSAWAASPARPNFVVFITDDQAFNGLSCTGNPVLKTPNMDRLAATGVLFEKAFVTTSICCCSRASMLTGQHMRRHGIEDFAKPLSSAQWQKTFPALLRQAGYRTGFLGKYAIGSPAVDKELALPEKQFDLWYGFPQSISFKQVVDGQTRYLTTVMEEKAGLKSGRAFADAMILGYTAVLTSPAFVCLEEQPGPLNESALEETQQFFGELVRADLPARNIVASDFVMVNEQLAKHYGLPAFEGVAIRRVSLPADSPRGGLLTQASVLKVTANGITTSPVLRGAWIMDRILGQPPRMPPPGTPAVESDTRGAITIRQQLDKHRTVEACAVCHTKIDPPGFALENFDVMGGWRDHYRATSMPATAEEGIGHGGQKLLLRFALPVDAAGELADGRKFADIREFKRLLLDNEIQLARNLTSQLTVYATGAPVLFSDRGQIDSILQRASASQYGVRTLIHELVQSELFRNK